jgi:hypothetical protein
MLRTFLQDESTDTNEPLIARIRKRPFYFIVILLCIINISLITINVGLWATATYQKLFFAADFTSFYTGFYMVRVGEGTNLYDVTLQSKYQQQFMDGMTFEGGVLRFANPPFIAIAFSPISWLHLDAAFYLWSLMQLGLLTWLLFRINRLFLHWERHERIVLIITILAFWPLTNNFLLGQFSLILLICLVQLYIYMKNSKLTKAGFWLALMTVKPHTLLIPGMMTLNKRYWRVAVTAAITGITFFSLSWLIIGLKPWIQYIQSLQALGSYFDKYGVNPNAEYTIRGVLSNILGNSQGSLTNIISIIVLLLGMIFIWFLWKKDIAQDSSRFILYFAFTILLSVFLSLHLNPHDSLMLVLPAALFYDYLSQNNYQRKAYSVLILISPLVFFVAAFVNFNLFGFIRPPVIIIFLMLAWMIKYLILDFKSQSKNREIIT